MEARNISEFPRELVARMTDFLRPSAEPCEAVEVPASFVHNINIIFVFLYFVLLFGVSLL